MTSFVFLVDSSSKPTETHIQLTELRSELDLEILAYQDVTTALAAVNALPQQPPPASFVVIASTIRDPIPAARAVHQASPQSYIIFVAGEEQAGALRDALGPFSLLGADWTIVSEGSGKLAAALREAYRSVHHQRRLRVTLDQINAQLSVHSPRTDASDRYGVSQRFLASILTNAHDGIIAADLEGRVRTWNEAAHQLFGIPDHGALGQALPSLARGEWQKAVPDLLSQLRKGTADHITAQLTVRRMDNTERFVDVVLAPIRDFSGALIGVSAIIRDITARRTAEIGLLDSERRMHTVLDHSPTVIFVLDPEDRYQFANRQWEIVTGRSRDEVIGKTLDEVWPIETARELAAGNHAVFAAGEPISQEERIPQADGTHVFLSQKFPLVDSNGRAYAVCGIATDISERKQLEDTLRDMNRILEERVRARTNELAKSNEALERSNLQLQRFAYIASHDLQAPLRAVTGFVQLLREEYAGRLDDRADDWINRIVAGAERMQALIRDILTYSSLDAATAPFEPVDLNAICDDAVRSLEPSIRDTDAEITRDDLPQVMGDRAQLAQLFQNLIDNAIKYRGDGAPIVHVSADRDGTTHIISVEDNGIGVPSTHVHSIFDVFQRLHSRRTYPGTGIGLAICRTVVQRHGGRIWVEPNTPQGSRFRFTIPQSRAPTNG